MEDLRRLPYNSFAPHPPAWKEQKTHGKLPHKSYSHVSICLCNGKTFHILPTNFSGKSSFPYTISSMSSFMTCGSVISLLCIQVSRLFFTICCRSLLFSPPLQDIFSCLYVWHVTAFPYSVFREEYLFLTWIPFVTFLCSRIIYISIFSGLSILTVDVVFNFYLSVTCYFTVTSTVSEHSLLHPEFCVQTVDTDLALCFWMGMLREIDERNELSPFYIR